MGGKHRYSMYHVHSCLQPLSVQRHNTSTQFPRGGEASKLHVCIVSQALKWPSHVRGPVALLWRTLRILQLHYAACAFCSWAVQSLQWRTAYTAARLQEKCKCIIRCQKNHSSVAGGSTLPTETLPPWATPWPMSTAGRDRWSPKHDLTFIYINGK